MSRLDENFWSQRYLNHTTGWDLGRVSPPLKTYFDHIENKSLKILIPGAGNAHEAEYLFNKGFQNVYVNDITTQALENFKLRVPKFPSSQLLNCNFFDIKSEFDLIIEQTFFCALEPDLRPKYAKKMHSLLSEKGKLIGLMFNVPLNDDQPPYGGHIEEYKSLFKSYFQINGMTPCKHSISSRAEKEIFIDLSKL